MALLRVRRRYGPRARGFRARPSQDIRRGRRGRPGRARALSMASAAHASGDSQRPLRELVRQGAHALASRVGMLLSRPKILPWLAWIPSLPSSFRSRYAARRGAWSRPPSRIPDALKTVPGIWRDRKVEDDTFERDPLHDFLGGNPWAIRFMTPH